ncbi:MAG: hypothetical protein DMF60_09040 [Acidobacteria bacterium]|nr:MAG: hypothetical protein DMF60_09040 [Acidobacteriota bacterium]
MKFDNLRRIRSGTRSVLRTLRDNRILAVFIALALVARLTFWFYTGRVWEDALITITAARNVWEGFGLTHHASEPYVQSFTSPLSVLIPILGESFQAGLLALRLSSLAASVATIYFAYRIGVLLAFHWVAQVLVLTYLACDQLQVFFGMGGMETQVVTAIAVAVLYFYLSHRWWLLGAACGLAAISRPEFIMFLLPPVGIALLLFHRRAILKVAIPTLALALPWYLFATLYYGSPVPNTIVAKSWSYQIGLFSASWQQVWNFTVRSWRDYAPFKEFWLSYETPLPDVVLKAIIALVLLLFLGGLLISALRKPGLLIAGVAFIGFVVYRNTTIVNSYYMWYLPPFMALFFLVAGYGLSELAAKAPRPAIALGVILALSYALHLPLSMPLDKKVQERIEVDVRERTGYLLAGMMKDPGDTVVLEPLGFMGWAAFNKTVYDFPGLGSKVAVRTTRNLSYPRVAGLLDALQPTYAVLRPNEFRDLVRRFPETAAKYELAARIRAAPDLTLRNMGYAYRPIDNDFRILRRTRDFDQVVRP